MLLYCNDTFYRKSKDFGKNTNSYVKECLTSRTRIGWCVRILVGENFELKQDKKYISWKGSTQAFTTSDYFLRKRNLAHNCQLQMSYTFSTNYLKYGGSNEDSWVYMGSKYSSPLKYKLEVSPNRLIFIIFKIPLEINLGMDR